jgi:CRISPR-associated endonuclease cas1, NMENI subtype
MIKRTLYFGNPAYLSLSSRQLVIRKSESQKEGAQGENICTRAIEDIGVIVIDHPQITLTSALIAALLDNNVALITCDSHHMPTGLLLPLSGNTIQSERFQAQVSASLPLKKQLWQQTVKQKIANQSTILRQLTSAEAGCMDKWSNDVRSGDIDNLEGRAAAYYWKNLFAQEIDHFKRGREEAAPNHLLNYGYAILRAIIARALVSSGLLPTLGIHHHNRYNAYCLADDIMEPYRPYVDAHVLVLLRQKGFQEELTQEDKAYLLQIPTLDVCVEGKRSPLLVAASLTTASVAKCFTGELRKISYPKL